MLQQFPAQAPVSTHLVLIHCKQSVDAMKEIASFCGKHSIHLISDEIYANSVFDNPVAPDAPPFTSILAIDLGDRIDPKLVHVTYGASKDFCANGLRLGMLYTKNEGLLGAVSSNAYVSPRSLFATITYPIR